MYSLLPCLLITLRFLQVQDFFIEIRSRYRLAYWAQLLRSSPVDSKTYKKDLQKRLINFQHTMLTKEQDFWNKHVHLSICR